MFESHQFLKVLVMNNENDIPASFEADPSEPKLLGCFECQLSRIVTARKSTLDWRDLTGPSPSAKYGKIKIKAEQLKNSIRPTPVASDKSLVPIEEGLAGAGQEHAESNQVPRPGVRACTVPAPCLAERGCLCRD